MKNETVEHGPFLIRVCGDRFVTRSDFRMFGGTVRLSVDPQRAKLFSRREAALDRVKVMAARAGAYEQDAYLKGLPVEVVPFSAVFQVKPGGLYALAKDVR